MGTTRAREKRYCDDRDGGDGKYIKSRRGSKLSGHSTTPASFRLASEREVPCHNCPMSLAALSGMAKEMKQVVWQRTRLLLLVGAAGIVGVWCGYRLY